MCFFDASCSLTWKLAIRQPDPPRRRLLFVTRSTKVFRVSKQINEALPNSSCFQLCFQTKTLCLCVLSCSILTTVHTHTDTHTCTKLAEEPRASGTWIRSHDREMEEGLLCLPHFSFPDSVCLHEWKEGRKFSLCVFCYWKITNKKKQTESENRSNCLLCSWSVSGTTPTLSTSNGCWSDNRRKAFVVLLCNMKAFSIRHL